MKCPICNKECGNSPNCDVCHFNEVGKTFINQDEAELWMKEVVLPFKLQYMVEHQKRVVSTIDNFFKAINIMQESVSLKKFPANLQEAGIKKLVQNDFLFFINRVCDFDANLNNKQFEFLCKYLDVVDNLGLYKLQIKMMEQMNNRGNITALQLFCKLEKDYGMELVHLYLNVLSMIAWYYFFDEQIGKIERKDDIIKLTHQYHQIAEKMVGKTVPFVPEELFM